MSPSTIPVLKVIRPGIFSALQDIGRFGYRHLGVPCSGASDRQSFIYVNATLHNPTNAPILEIFGQNAEFEVLNPVRIFIAGAFAIVTLDDLPVEFFGPLHVKSGQKLKIEKLINGAVVYVGIEGGFSAVPVMGSVSTISGSHLKPVSKNDILYSSSQTNISSVNHGILKPIKINTNSHITITPGPEFEVLDNISQQRIFTSIFNITKDSNRMGYRLLGEMLTRNTTNDMLTSAVAPGVIQLLPDGQLIILMRDCQTTGGYPRILIVDESDINQLAQRNPGKNITFKLK